MKNFIIFCLSLTLIILFAEEPVKEYIAKKNDYKIEDIKIYKDTPAWKLAKLIESQETEKIEEEIRKHPDLLNYQDPRYGSTLLIWSVAREKYEAAKTLLECGADPDIATRIDGATPLQVAAGYSSTYNTEQTDPRYLNILLQYGADPNIVYRGENDNDPFSGSSPLMGSITFGIEKTKALVEAGADVNYKDRFGVSAATFALRFDDFPEYAHYLIVEKHADITVRTDYDSLDYESDNLKNYPPVRSLRNWEFEEGSEEYQMKLEIIDEFARQGVEY